MKCCCCDEERRLIEVLKKISSVLVKHSEEEMRLVSTNDLLDLLRRVFNRAADYYYNSDKEKVILSFDFYQTVRRIFFQLAENADIKSGRSAMRSFCYALEPILQVKLRVALSRLDLAFSLVELEMSLLIGSFVDGILCCVAHPLP